MANQLITAAEVVQITSLAQNTDQTKIEPFIEPLQLKQALRVLGKPLYDSLLDSLNTNLAITNVTATTPIQVTTAANHNAATGDTVRIEGVQGIPQSVGTFTVTVLSPTLFSLNNTTGVGAYVPATGTVVAILSPLYSDILGYLKKMMAWMIYSDATYELWAATGNAGTQKQETEQAKSVDMRDLEGMKNARWATGTAFRDTLVDLLRNEAEAGNLPLYQNNQANPDTSDKNNLPFYFRIQRPILRNKWGK